MRIGLDHLFSFCRPEKRQARKKGEPAIDQKKEKKEEKRGEGVREDENGVFARKAEDRDR